VRCTIFSLYLITQLPEDFINKVLLGFSEYYIKMEEKPFECEICGNGREFIWKTRHGKNTSILTLFQKVYLNQLQVKCKECGHKFYIIRKLLGG
jgi:Zn finger protein HypA/HybF involved in hydrogenase expression